MKPKITILQNQYANMWYYPNEGIIHHKILQPISGDEFKNLLLNGLTVIKKYGAQKWLSDDRNNSYFVGEDTAWSEDIWRPQAVKAGWKYWALIPPDNARGQINMQRLTTNVEHYKIDIKVFTDPTEAFEWLASLG